MRHGSFDGERVCSACRRGFTLVELLVVITIIGMLIALLLPAVQAARESARRMHCGNNLKQLGLGFHNFESANGGFPPRRWSRNPDANGNGGNGYTGWGTFLLPFIEQQPIYDAYKWQYDFYDPVNKAVVETKLPMFICPSTPRMAPIVCSGPATTGSANPDKTTTHSVNGWIDYLAPNGFVTPSNGWGVDFPGYTKANSTSGNGKEAMLDSSPMFTPTNFSRAPRSLGEIKDGLSNTLLINETAGWPQHYVGGQPTNTLSPGNRGSWAGWQSYVYYTYSYDGTMDSYDNQTAGDLVVYPMNRENCHQMFSFHPGGVLALFCDGSVRFLAETLSPLAFAQIVIIDDGQVITDTTVQ